MRHASSRKEINVHLRPIWAERISASAFQTATQSKLQSLVDLLLSEPTCLDGWLAFGGKEILDVGKWANLGAQEGGEGYVVMSTSPWEDIQTSEA